MPLTSLADLTNPITGAIVDFDDPVKLLAELKVSVQTAEIMQQHVRDVIAGFDAHCARKAKGRITDNEPLPF